MAGYPILNIPTGDLGEWGAGAAEADIVVTNFNQSLGAELIASGDMSSLWGANGTPTTRELVSGRLHIVTDAANEGAAESFDNTTAGIWYTFGLDYEIISGNMHFWLANTGPKYQNWYVIGTHTREAVFLETHSNARTPMLQSGDAGASEFYADNATRKAITLNTQQTGWADAISQLFYTLPGSPKSLQESALLWRIQDASNFWITSIRRNLANSAWEFNIWSVASNTFTLVYGPEDPGSTDGLKVVTSGNNYAVSTRDTGVWTQRHAAASALYNTQPGINVVYSPSFTPTKLLIDEN